jgi:hypothetical protein
VSSKNAPLPNQSYLRIARHSFPIRFLRRIGALEHSHKM